MHRCLELAANGMGFVAPNPMVGCVIVAGGKIIAEGYHKKYGEAHAEVNAINQLPSDFDFSDCTLFVNLEPCSHYGKTPPCSDLIISKKFKKVVIANTDSNPLVGGKGIAKLIAAGIEVEQGVLEKEGRELNKRFFTLQEKKRPYVILKWAQTANGLISRWPLSDNKEDNWITCNESKQLVHSWRAQEQAIMIGTNTAINDNPQLTVRYGKGKNPIRVILDKNLRLPGHLEVFNTESPTIIFNTKIQKSEENLSLIKINESDFTLENILLELGKQNISSVFVEGGAKLLNSIIHSGLWDEARVLVNPTLNFKNGIKAPDIHLPSDKKKSGTDELYLINNYNS